MTSPTKAPNRLIDEKSPYLLQHAYNPVDWWPWCDEAFEKAKGEDKPIFLSIGYSCCHWCHVMAHESFEDESTAALLNEGFVCVKVDREERPDVDALYMAACVELTGSGGWPLNVLLTPEKKPFGAFTYLPRTRRAGMRGLDEVLSRITQVWRFEREKLLDAADQILCSVEQAGSKGSLDEGAAERAAGYLLSRWDREYGGFGRAPKFPTTQHLFFLMHLAQKETDEHPFWQCVASALDGMMKGGIRDHIGGGFCRYSTDRQWLVPHFEKMLYDNALLLMAYAQGYLRLQKQAYAQVAMDTAEFMLREMRDVGGGFYTAQDADNELGEGAYYLWQPSQVEAVLGSTEGKRFCMLYDITERGNYEGKSIPNIIGRDFTPSDEIFARRCVKALYAARQLRKLPMTDVKMLLSANGLAIAALSFAARIFGQPEWLDAASKATRFILEQFTRDENRLYGVYTLDKARQDATLDGYAYFLWGLIELYQATGEAQWLSRAISLLSGLSGFADGQGGYYFSSEHSQDLPLRVRNAEDGAIPSAHGVLASCLIRLSRLSGNPEWEADAHALIASLANDANAEPLAHMALHLSVLQLHDVDVVLVPGEGLGQMRSACSDFAGAVHLAVAGNEEMENVAPFTRDMKALFGKATAYVCHDGACGEPITDPQVLRQTVARHLHMPQ